MYRFFIFLGCFCGFLTHAQDEPDTVLINSGGVNIADLEMTHYSKDSSASAVVLFKKGSVGYDAPKRRFYLVLHAQTKIFNSKAFDLANVSLIHTKKTWMRVMGHTYNLQNGEIVTTDLSEDEIITDEVTDKVFKTSFALPNIKEGSVLEYKYILFSESPFEFLPWYFQEKYPVVFSEISISFPQINQFKPRLHGYIEPNEISADGSKKWYRVNMFDIPALSEEPHVRNIRDHYAKLSFVYAGSFYRSWSSLAEWLTKSDQYFGDAFSKDKWLNRFTEDFEKWNTSDMKTVQSIYDFVTKSMKWDGRYRLFPDGYIKKAWDAGEGSSADINLIFIMLLRKAGFNAYPVLISTAENGEVAKELVSYGQFNTVVALLDLGGNRTLINATDKNRPLESLPINFLNSEGLLVKPKGFEWVSTNLNSERDIQTIGVSAKIDSELGLITGELSLSLTGGRAVDLRNEGQGKTSAEIFDLGSNITSNIEVDSIKVKDFETLDKPLQIKTLFTDEHSVSNAGERLFFSPVIFNNLEQNPFIGVERQFPVEFARPFNNRLLFEFDIPEGYEAEQLPDAANYSLPEGAGRYTYQANKEENKLIIYINLIINKPIFYPHEYEGLRKLFEMATFKQSEMVVLKKND